MLIRAADAAQGIGDRRLRAYALEGLARCAIEDGDASTARSLAADALATANELGDPSLRVEAALSVAAADALAGHRERSLKTARAALGVSRRHGNQPGAMRAAVVLAETLGRDEAIARRAVAVLATESRAAPEVRRRASELAAAWADVSHTARDGGSVPGDGDPDADAWDDLAARLVTPS